MSANDPRYEPDISGGAAAGIGFAAVILLMIGVFQFVIGLAAIIEDDLFVVGREYAFELDITAWGWLHLLIGIVLVLTGIGLFGRKAWAGVTAIVLATLSAIANFFFIPYYPAWSILIIALNIWVIWALTRPGAIRT